MRNKKENDRRYYAKNRMQILARNKRYSRLNKNKIYLQKKNYQSINKYSRKERRSILKITKEKFLNDKGCIEFSTKKKLERETEDII
jgi:hypothetical protein